MGKVGGFLVGAGMVVAGTLTGQGWLVSLGVSQMLGAVASTLQPGERQRALEVNTANTQTSLPTIYGEAKVGIRLVELRVSGEDNRNLYIVGALCHGSSDGSGIEAIDEVYFDDRRAFSAGGTAESWLNGKADLIKHLGTDAQSVDSAMNTIFPSDWPSTSKGRGIAYIVLRIAYDKEIFGSGIPNVTAIVRGCKVKDPSNLAAAATYSTNPMRCLYDYLTSTRYGARVPAAEIDATSLASMASYCDEMVSIPPSGTQKRFECNGVLDISQSVQVNIDQILTSCRGNLVYQNGQYRAFIRRAVTPTTFKLTEENTVGGVGLRTLGMAECPNIIRVTHIEPNTEETVDGVIYAPTYAAETRYWPRPDATNAYVTADNDFEVPQDLQLPCTHSPLTAEQIAMVTLREQRGVSSAGAIGVRILALEEALKLQVGDVVPLTRDTPGWVEKDFWVMNIASMDGGLVELVLLEYNEDAYSLDAQAVFPSRPATNLPNPFTVAAPTDLVLTSSSATAIRTVEGIYQPAIKVTWTASVHPYVDYYEIEAKRAADSVWLPYVLPDSTSEEATVAPVTAYEPWDVRVSAVNTLGKRSAWVSETITTGAASPVIRPEGRNLIVNGNGEQGTVDGNAPGWATADGVAVKVDDDSAMVGTRSLKMTHGSADESIATQDVDFLAGRVYRLSGGLKHGGTTGTGAGVAIGLIPDSGQVLTVLERQGTALGSASDPDVGIEAGSAVDWTPSQLLVTPDIDGTGKVALYFGYDNTLTGTARFADVKCEEVPADTTIGGKRGFDRIDEDGTFYVPAGESIIVGEQGTPSSKTKTVRFSPQNFKAKDPTQLTDFSWYSGFVPELDCRVGKATDIAAMFFFAKGVTITAVRTRFIRNGAALAAMKFYRDGTLLATNTHSASGASIVASSISQLVGDEAYACVGQLDAPGLDSCSFYWVEFDYTMPKFDFSY